MYIHCVDNYRTNGYTVTVSYCIFTKLTIYGQFSSVHVHVCMCACVCEGGKGIFFVIPYETEMRKFFTTVPTAYTFHVDVTRVVAVIVIFRKGFGFHGLSGKCFPRPFVTGYRAHREHVVFNYDRGSHIFFEWVWYCTVCGFKLY